MGKKKKKFITAIKSYEEQGVIGEGGSGIVYKVQDEHGEIYALKMLRGSVSKEKRSRFKNELHFQFRNTHPNIISVSDYGAYYEGEVDVPFYVMPYYNKSLRDLMNEGIESNKIEQYFSSILDGIESAHKFNITHRDIKPENILYNPQRNELLIADFGIARFEEIDLYTAVQTKDTTRLANFRYSAPEQRDPKSYLKADNRTDIYSLGLILNEMFTGDVPQGNGYKNITSKASEFSYLDAIVEKMIMQNQEDRYTSIEEVKNDLSGYKFRFIEQQKLNEAKSKVIKVSEIDDILIDDPPRLIDAKWENGTLTLTLSQSVNQKWIKALHNMGSYTSLMGHPPEAFSFNGTKVRTSIPDYDAQRAIDYFKEWLPIANSIYKRTIEQESKAEANRLKQEAEALIRKREKNLKVNSQLRI